MTEFPTREDFLKPRDALDKNPKRADPRDVIGVGDEFTPFIHLDPAMLDILSLADQIAPYDASVLITGESGTGKEVLARHLHAKSSRAERQFIALNCAAIPEGLLESELFGHEKGAFTGAVRRHIGKFQEAHRGTLLLDEISEMHPRLQAKLLRAVQEREIDRVGGSRPIKVDIRLLATTNRNLEDEVRKGNFREDLYFRLNVVNIELPALRDRPRDIEVLAEHFVAKYAEANGVPVPILSAEAHELLRRHHWRGNVRELENAMHRAVILGQGNLITPRSIFLADGSLAINDHTPMADVRDFMGHTVADAERKLILETLQRCGGNRTHAADVLGISVRTLRNKLKSYKKDRVFIPMPRQDVTRSQDAEQTFPEVVGGEDNGREFSSDAVKRAESVIDLVRARAQNKTLSSPQPRTNNAVVLPLKKT